MRGSESMYTSSPEPNISTERISKALHREVDKDFINKPSIEGVYNTAPVIEYPLILVLDMHTVKVKNILDEYLDKIADGGDGKEITLMYKTQKNGKDVVAMWRKTIVNINFLNLLDSFLLRTVYYESKGNKRELRKEDFLDLEEIRKHIVEDDVVLDYGVDESKEFIDYTGMDILYSPTVAPSEEVEDLVSPVVKPNEIEVKDLADDVIIPNSEEIDNTSNSEEIGNTPEPVKAIGFGEVIEK